ncbi:hypothetical protein R1sor_003152 [Riccia sorocarpa]|uniref:Uncharacterized protein n=1 Tax=Riccia sorocarpa TaxID=122646 RepID=A0ABD3H445_9MARC
MAVPWRVSKNCVMEVERDCRRCNKSLHIEDFFRRQCRSNVTKVHRECNVCFSSRQTTRLYEPVPDTPNEELVVKTCTYEQLSHMASVAFREAAIDEVVVYRHWVVDCSEEYMEALTSWEGSKNLAFVSKNGSMMWCDLRLKLAVVYIGN